MPMSDKKRSIPLSIQIPGTAAAYYFAGKLGLLFAIAPGYATPIWLPSGIALAAVLLLGYRVWPGIWVGSFLVNLGTGFKTDSVASVLESMFLPASIGLGAALQGLAGGYLIHRWVRSESPLDRVRSTTEFLILGGPVSCLVNSTWGAIGLWLSHKIGSEQFVITWWTWWLGDAAGVLVITPVAIAWEAGRGHVLKQDKILTAFLLAALLVLTSEMVFGGWFPRISPGYPLEFIPIPLIIIAAYHFGQRGATLATLIIAAVVVSGTMTGSGPFKRETLNESLLLVQAYVSIVGGAALLLAAAVTERECAERELSESQRFLQSALDSLTERIAILDESGMIIEINEAWRRGTGRMGFLGGTCGAGMNFFDHCSGASKGACEVTPKIVGGVREVIEHRRDTFHIEYMFRALEESRWFALRVTRFEGAAGIRVVLAQEDISDRKFAEEQLRRRASHDALTGAANRTTCIEALQQAIAKKERHERYRFAVLFLDLDGFKAVNDAFGHSIGDQILVAATRRIQGCLRGSDLLARVGGDEFVVILDDLQDPDEVDLITQRIRKEIKAPYHVDGSDIELSASVGIVTSHQNLTTAEEFIRLADRAMYEAKREVG